MDSIKVIVGDDHQDSLEIIKYFINNIPGFEVIEECINGEQLIDGVILKKPDLVVTDINMPVKNGMEAIKECLSFRPDLPFIFTTGYDQYALEAFDISAVDYLVKPLEKDRVEEALNKAKRVIRYKRNTQGISTTEHKKKVLSLRIQNSTYFIPLAEIYFIEKSGRKCLVYTKKEIHETTETMSGIQEKLDDHFFLAHRSYIINLKEILQISAHNESYIVTFKDYNKKASISKLKINEVRKRIHYNP